MQNKGMVNYQLTEKEVKQIEFQRKLAFGKIEVHIQDSRPVRIVNIRESIQL